MMQTRIVSMPKKKLTLVHFTDIRLQDHNPPSRLGSYRKDILDKLRRVGDIGASYGASAYTCGGDWFHDKAPTKTSYSLSYELGTILKSFGAPVLTVLGNHDLRFDRTDTMPEQPIGSLLNGGIIKLQDGEILREGGVSVRMAGFDFSEEPSLESISLKDELKPLADYHVLSLHVYASPSGGTLYGKTRLFSYKELLTLGYDVILLGHYHSDQGVLKLTRDDGSSCHFVNIGSLSRGEYGDEVLNRVPKCCVVSFGKEEGVSFTEVPVGARPASEVFDVQEKQEIKRKEQEAAKFVEQLKAASMEKKEATVKSPEELLETVLVDDEAVLSKVRGFLETARALISAGRR